jgi:hypothetical protein
MSNYTVVDCFGRPVGRRWEGGIDEMYDTVVTTSHSIRLYTLPIHIEQRWLVCFATSNIPR